MTIISFASCTGGPGATTTALATAAALMRTDIGEVIFVEAAESGGVVASQYDLPPEPGLTSLALALSSDAPDPLRHAQELPGGLPVVVAPLSASKTTKLLEARGLQLAIYLRSLPMAIVADCGRLSIGSPVVSVLEASSLVGMVVRPTRESFRLAATTLAEVGETTSAPIPAGWVIVGESAWSYDEIITQYGLPVLATIALDRAGADAVAGLSKMRRRSPLARSAQSFADDVVKHLRVSRADAPLDYLQHRPGRDDESGEDGEDDASAPPRRIRTTAGRFTKPPSASGPSAPPADPAVVTVDAPAPGERYDEADDRTPEPSASGKATL